MVDNDKPGGGRVLQRAIAILDAGPGFPSAVKTLGAIIITRSLLGGGMQALTSSGLVSAEASAIAPCFTMYSRALPRCPHMDSLYSIGSAGLALDVFSFSAKFLLNGKMHTPNNGHSVRALIGLPACACA
jgi:hypothetical protein